MLGYHDCPPHMFESLDKELDAKWIRKYKRSAEQIQETLKKARELTKMARSEFRGGFIPSCSCNKRYK